MAFSSHFSYNNREVFYMFLTLCNEQRILQTKRNGHLTFQYVIDCWGMCLAILSCNLAACSSHNCVTKTSGRKN